MSSSSATDHSGAAVPSGEDVTVDREEAVRARFVEADVQHAADAATASPPSRTPETAIR